MIGWSDFYGPNAGYALELYEKYQQDPNAVDTTTQQFFEQNPPPTLTDLPVNGKPNTTTAPTVDATNKVFAAVNYAQALREHGHEAAQIDPLGHPPLGDPALVQESYDLSDDDLRSLPAHIVGGPIGETASNAFEAIQALRQIYCSGVGYDFVHIRMSEERKWLYDKVEAGEFTPATTPLDEKAMLDELTRVEAFEHLLHRAFPGKTRFSIEGLDMMVPLLNEMLRQSAQLDIRRILIGMAHRGRLNVLTHVLQKPYEQILAEFKDPVGSTYASDRESLGWTGDVKYHTGAYRTMDTGKPFEIEISMAPNPSHLEHVNPVVVGMARAAGTAADQRGPVQFNRIHSVPVIIHGDAAFTGQGVVTETFNMYRLPGYRVGGALHIIANNQVGFTANPDEGRSTVHASDLAKGFKIPIIRVNADDVEACVAVARLAVAYLAEFKKDVVIDLIGYRRYGHNEGDEPRFTQPSLYDKIDQHPTVRQIWAKTLSERGVVTEDEAQSMYDSQMDKLQQVFDQLEPERDLPEPSLEKPEPGTAKRVKTGISAERLRALNEALLQLPEGFNLNSKVKRLFKRWATALDEMDEPTIEWARAEALAFASILEDGTPIRLTGEDVGRGTFSHRHARLLDQKTDAVHIPLQTLPQAEVSFEIRNSPLSENGAIGFEYGYNIQAPERLVIWEGQYGDFVNGAQAMLDEFVTSGFAKWGQTPSLVLLLPHGYEGAGPDHSTGRLERFLQSAAEINMRIANCTTAAQYFHLLRRQAALLHSDPLPLVIMSPKSLLRHPMVASPLRDFVEKNWQPVIDDVEAQQKPDKIKKVIACSGKIYVDLVSSEYREKHPEIAIIRIEQLYPLPADLIGDTLQAYPKMKQLAWVQEEPRNMGAWSSLKPQFERIREIIGGKWDVKYIGRPRRASPAEGTSAWHNVNQKALIARAFEG